MSQESLAVDHYDEVVAKLQLEEAKVNVDLQKNSLLLPNIVKKGMVNLQVDQRLMKDFKDERDPSNFEFYLGQRRDSKQSIESAMTQCAQFGTYCKSKSPDLKDLKRPKEFFHEISTRWVSKSFNYDLVSSHWNRYPTLPHQYFDHLQKSNIKASSILGRIDSLILLFDWIRINSNDINVYKDVSLLFPFSQSNLTYPIQLDEWKTQTWSEDLSTDGQEIHQEANLGSPNWTEGMGSRRNGGAGGDDDWLILLLWFFGGFLLLPSTQLPPIFVGSWLCIGVSLGHGIQC